MLHEEWLNINNSYLFLTELHMCRVRTAHLKRFGQNLEIGACCVLGNVYTYTVTCVRDMYKRAQILRVRYRQSMSTNIANH